MDTTAIIPARSGSKRIPNKNVKLLDGIPLVEHTIRTALACDRFDRVVMTSDDYKWVADRYQDLIYIKRPQNLCGDDIADQEVIYHAITELKPTTGLAVYLRPTTPFRVLYHLEEALKLFENLLDSATGLRSIERMGESAFKCFTFNLAQIRPILDETGTDCTDMPNHMVTPTYKTNGYIDIAKVEEVLAGNLWGDKIAGYLTPHTVEIDTPEDWAYAEYYAQRQLPQIIEFWKEP